MVLWSINITQTIVLIVQCPVLKNWRSVLPNGTQRLGQPAPFIYQHTRPVNYVASHDDYDVYEINEDSLVDEID